ncbi:MAG: hypothetical protein V3U54_13080 [Thermodesulfobacteriota bacterium]
MADTLVLLGIYFFGLLVRYLIPVLLKSWKAGYLIELEARWAISSAVSALFGIGFAFFTELASYPEPGVYFFTFFLALGLNEIANYFVKGREVQQTRKKF